MARSRAAGNSHRRPARRVNPTLANDVSAPGQRLRYYSMLVDLMTHKTSETYPADHTFTTEELLTITPQDVKEWMCFRAYGMIDPGPDDNPIYLRSSTLEYYKKAVSYFVPNTHMPWHVDATSPTQGRGNPTRSLEVNRLIAAVKAKEVRKLGKESKADRAFTKEEFLQVKELVGTYGIDLNRLRHIAMLSLQYHMIGRCDDIAHIKKDSLQASDQFPGYLTVKMRWSKNVREERDCPNQIIMGSINTKYCVLLPLAIFLEQWIKHGEGVRSQWLFCDGQTTRNATQTAQEKEADVLKTAYTRAIKFATDNTSFIRSTRRGNLGSHSIRKLATTVCRNSGASKDETDYRARWKSKRMQERYTDTQLNWPDIRAASKLCDGGICLYKVKHGIGLHDDYIANSFAPGITSVFGEDVGAVLGKVLLWAAVGLNEMAEVIPQDLRQAVNREWNQCPAAANRGNEFNPIERVEIIPSEQDGTVSMDIVPNEDAYPEGDDDEPGPQGATGGGGIPLARHNIQWRAALYAKISSTHTRVSHMENHVVAELAEMKRRNRRMEEMIRVLMLRPANVVAPTGAAPIRLGANATAIAGQDARPAVLARHPRTLELLWDEWQNGLQGNKPAREFTKSERGRNKHKFCRRLVFWKCMIRLLRNGCDVATAIGRIKGVYGVTTVTKTINAMKPHERAGGHFDLRA